VPPRQTLGTATHTAGSPTQSTPSTAALFSVDSWRNTQIENEKKE